MDKKDTQKGFALIYAVLVAILVISVGASVISMALRQIVLTGTARESQYAFYAANTGIECARFWDTHSEIPGETPFPVTGAGESNSSFDYTDLKCGSGYDGENFVRVSTSADIDPILTIPYPGSGDKKLIVFKLSSSVPPSLGLAPIESCVEVLIDPKVNAEGLIDVEITSQGLNDCDINSPRAVQRGLKLKYSRQPYVNE